MMEELLLLDVVGDEHVQLLFTVEKRKMVVGWMLSKEEIKVVLAEMELRLMSYVVSRRRKADGRGRLLWNEGQLGEVVAEIVSYVRIPEMGGSGRWMRKIIGGSVMTRKGGRLWRDL
ncbi:hypothetical protein RYX36_013403 [Vicia faba]